MSDLSSFLEFKTPDKDRRRRLLGAVIAGTLLLIACAILLWPLVADDPLGGEPVARAKIEGGNDLVGREDVTVVGVKSGSGEILPPIEAVAAENRGPTEEIAAETSVTPEKATPASAGPLEDLQEEGLHGLLPKISPNGLRPLDAYARPVPVSIGASPRVVIIVAGLGLSKSGTEEALRQLPPDVTLAFTPYGSNLEGWIGKARQAGYEILLQLPLEPFDYPDNDPGPQTLLVDAGSKKNLDNLHWILSRATSYVGVISHMGARFKAETDALAPVMKEIAARGLLFVDEGASARGKGAEIAAAASSPFANVDLVIDEVADEQEIVSRLAQLEQIARSRGLAVGVSSALPVSVREITAWAKGLEARGISITPVSASLRKEETEFVSEAKP